MPRRRPVPLCLALLLASAPTTGQSRPDSRLDRGSPPGAANSDSVRIAAAGLLVCAVWRELAGPAHDGAVHGAWLDRRNATARWDVYHSLLRGFRSHGDGTTGTGGLVPTLLGSGQPWTGGTVHVDLATARGGAIAVVLMSVTGRAAIPFGNGTLHLAQPWFDLWGTLGGAAGAAGGGSANLFAPLPNVPTLLGAALQFQAVVFDPAGNAGVALTKGLELWIL